MNILDYIPKGRVNAISRQELVNRTGLPDRTARKEIKKLVEKGIPIVSFSDEKGYWISDDINEIERFIKEYDVRNATGNKTTYQLRLMVSKAKGERLIPVKAHLRRIKSTEIEGQETL